MFYYIFLDLKECTMTLYGKVKKQKFLAWESNNAAGEPTYIPQCPDIYSRQHANTCHCLTSLKKGHITSITIKWDHATIILRVSEQNISGMYLDICHHIKCSDYWISIFIHYYIPMRHCYEIIWRPRPPDGKNRFLCFFFLQLTKTKKPIFSSLLMASWLELNKYRSLARQQ